ncbi:MAG: hypothetical protein J7513_03675 [Solirubrobacteraceae bacterium]|nr:hypothetical protein [Solirubrobacteraceae bacterium]
MSQEFRNIKWNGTVKAPVIEVDEPVRFSLDGDDMSGTIVKVKGRELGPDGQVLSRGQVTFKYEDITGMELTHTVVGPK